MMTKTTTPAIRAAAIKGHPAQPASAPRRNDQVPITISANSKPNNLSHHGPCSAADTQHATPKESSKTSGQTSCSGNPSPVAETIRLLWRRMNPETITVAAATPKAT
jgi:hypothetical protein